MSYDFRLSESKSIALSAIIPRVFVVNLLAYYPSFEDTATYPITLWEKRGRGKKEKDSKAKTGKDLNKVQESRLAADDGKL